MLKFYLKSIVGSIIFPFYLLIYTLRKQNTTRSHLSMLYAFLFSNGRILDAIAKITSTLSPYKSYHGAETLSVNLDEVNVVQQLREDGYVVIPNAISEDLMNDILSSLDELLVIPRKTDNGSQLSKTYFDAQNLTSVRYDYEAADILNLKPVQDILASPTLINIAGQYLGTMPVADIVGLWWNTNYGDTPDSNAAQYFHYDLDRLKWLKVFIYLTDVGEENGPHEFVRGSHKSGHMPLTVRQKLYTRISDKEISDTYGDQNRITMTGKKGTLIFEDTRGFHKGNEVIANPRLVLQLQFSLSSFGAVYPKERITAVKSTPLNALLQSDHRNILREYS